MRRIGFVVTAMLLLCLGAISLAQQAPCTIERNTEFGVRALTFEKDEDGLLVPGTLFFLDCSASPEDLALIDTSPSVGFGERIPRPRNPSSVTSEQPGFAIVNTSAANLRSGAGTVYTRVGVVRGGEELLVLGRNPRRTWWYTQAGDVRGWISASIIIIRGDVSDVPIVETTGEIAQPTLYVGWGGNPVYATPGGAGICTIPGRSEFRLLARNANASWYLIEARCEDGTVTEAWIAASLGIVRNPGRVQLPIIR